jgi:peptidoglycan/LPS O-acetylase OafA/YrhL
LDAEQMNKTTRITALDGWRGMAIGLVLVGHFFPLPGSQLGRLGVEFFFILSGRLMAQILFDAKLPLPIFFWRRFSRVAPGLFVFCAVVFSLASLGYFAPSGLEYFSVLTFWSNYLFTFAPREPIFGHTWSLAIEEHSYIILAFVAFLTRRRTNGALFLVGGLILLFMARGLYLTLFEGMGYYEVYWRTDVRAATLFLGFLFYLIHRTRGLVIVNRLADAPQWVIIFLFFGIIVQFASVVPNPVKYTIGSTMLALLLLAVEQRCAKDAPNDLVKLIQTPALLFLGQVSYSVYLYQQIFHALKAPLSGYYAPLFVVPALLVGYLSYRLVERPTGAVLRKVF